jgi:hypothetical protein
LVTRKTFQSDVGFSAQLVVPTTLQIGNGYAVGDHSIVKFNATPAVVPEPGTCTLFLLVSIGLGIAARRRRNRQLAA